jgi:hypothetical protein|tara:strand:+ start:537 stop:743 length:207 start_codon:yes stop_codon:yes gene_type:complete
MILSSREVFSSHRIKEKAEEQLNSIILLASQGYTVIDLEGNIINKSNLDMQEKPKLGYNRVPKLQQYI